MDLDPCVASLSYKPGWAFKRGGPHGRFLCVFAYTVDSSARDRKRTTQHMFEFPADGFVDHRGFCRWVFDKLMLCELHECGEFFGYGKERPFLPGHQGNDPYVRVERWESSCL